MSEKKPRNPVSKNTERRPYRVLHGSDWLNTPFSAATRYWGNPSNRIGSIGLRIARTVKK